ncbi:MAG: hypothetical protein KF819_05230 [Labilithrix sp.]|nr:hypothetical protein [Labilithrix sp.]
MRAFVVAIAIVACACGAGGEAAAPRSGPLTCDEHCASIEKSCGPRAPQGECAEYCRGWASSIKAPDSAACRDASSDYFACRQALFIELCSAGPHDVQRCNAKAESAKLACSGD